MIDVNFGGGSYQAPQVEKEMNGGMKKIVAATAMIVTLIGAGQAFAGSHYGRMPERGWQGQCPGGQQYSRHAEMTTLFEKAPQAVKDAVKEMDIKRSELSLEIAKGNTDTRKLTALHNDILKARRVMSDYSFDQALNNPQEARRLHGGGRGPGMHGGMFYGFNSELAKDRPDAAKAKQIYNDTMNLRDKHAKERFELSLKYPEGLAGRHRGHF